MTKDAVGDWDTTAANNTDIKGINIAEGCAPSTINNAIREMMAQLAAEKATQDAAVFPGAIWGLTLSNDTDTDHDINVTAGAAASDASSPTLMTLSSEITKRIDATWSVGDDAGGLDTGSVANSTTYHVYLIERSDTGVVDVLFSTSASSPTMPSNYDRKRRIGSVVTDGSANIRGFSQNGDKFEWNASVPDVVAANPGTSAVTRTLTVPTGIVVDAILEIHLANAGIAVAAAALVTALTVTDVVVAENGPADIEAIFSGTGGQRAASTNKIVKTNTSAQVRSRLSQSDVNVGFRLRTNGWIDRRGKDA